MFSVDIVFHVQFSPILSFGNNLNVNELNTDEFKFKLKKTNKCKKNDWEKVRCVYSRFGFWIFID